MLQEKMTSRRAEMLDQIVAVGDGHLELSGQTALAEKGRCAAVDELFGQPDIVTAQTCAASRA